MYSLYPEASGGLGTLPVERLVAGVASSAQIGISRIRSSFRNPW